MLSQFSCWLLVVGCWLLIVDCWLLVVGCWLLFYTSHTPHHPITPSPHHPTFYYPSLTAVFAAN
ncbi:hypothetical protein [Fischerella thermalis]|uniref:hypothetical protein n=1 Tax=Fischerella thermalis TaxID=372787 RepID=UPI00307DBB79